MATSFISYARSDAAKVREYCDRLEELGVDHWIDTKNIPPSVNWYQEIVRAIVHAQSFVCFVSASFLRSETCLKEIGCAVEHQKRIVLVRLDDADLQPLQLRLDKLSWDSVPIIDLTTVPDPSTAQTIQELAQEASYHTELAIKAEQWESGGRDDGLLLQRQQLARAEDWLNEPATGRIASAHQVRLVAASRRALARKRNRLVRLASIGIVIALGLTVLVMQQRSRALEDRDQSDSRRLTAQAYGLKDDFVDLAYLLGAEAWRLHDSAESRFGLLEILQSYDGLVRLLPAHTQQVEAVDTSPDGTRFVTAGMDSVVIVWDFDRLEPVGPPLTGHTDYIYGVRFSPDGSLIGSVDASGQVMLWDSITLEERWRVELPDAERVFELDFVFGGEKLAVTGGKTSIVLLSVKDGRTVGSPLVGHQSHVYAVAACRTAPLLASGDFDGEVILWRLEETPSIAGRYQTGSGGIRHLSFRSDGRYLIAGGIDTDLLIWNLENAADGDFVPEAIDSRSFVAAYGVVGDIHATSGLSDEITVWNPPFAKGLSIRYTGHGGSVSDLAIHPDGRRMISVGDPNVVAVWELQPYPRLGASVTCPDTALLDVGFDRNGDQLLISAMDARIHRYDSITGDSLGTLSVAGHEVYRFAVSPIGNRAASVGVDSTVVFWDLAEGVPRSAPLRAHRGFLWDIAYRPDGRTIATCGNDSTIRLWNAKTMMIDGPALRGHRACVNGIDFSPDGATLASVAGDSTVRLWNLDTRSETGPALKEHQSETKCVAFSPDGRYLATGDAEGRVMLWNTDDFTAAGIPLVGHLKMIQDLEFSPDSSLLVSASTDCAVMVWDVESRRKVSETLGHHQGVATSIAFHPSGDRLVSCGWDATAFTWDLDARSWFETARRIAGRKLTAEEWNYYLGENRPYPE